MKDYYRCMYCGQVYRGYFCPKCGRINPNLTYKTEKLSKPLSAKIRDFLKIKDKK